MGRHRPSRRAKSCTCIGRCKNRARVRVLRRFPNEQPYALPCRFSNMLCLLPRDRQPRSEIVGPKLASMDKSIAQLDAVVVKLVGFQLAR